MTTLSRKARPQTERLLDYLRTYKSISTLEARAILDILAPATRIKDLREDGHKIVTHWSEEDTPLSTHKVARYVLMAGG
ncbi:MAG: helix-turn-helix domain-containing protein [Methylomonas sp.]